MVLAGLASVLFTGALSAGEPPAAPLPAGVKAVWDMTRAHRETTATRERISINGLWRFQPAEAGVEGPPAAGWGHFKVCLLYTSDAADE